MAQYPNYYPQMNSYGQQFNTQQPYMDRLNNLQQYQQNLQMFPSQMSGTPQQLFQQAPAGLNGRFVDDFSILNANDVPMDGSGAVFIKRDASEIQWRRWGNMGNIEMTSYKPNLEQNNQEGTNIPQMDFNGLYEDMKALIEEITERFDRLEKSMTAPTTKSSSSRAKKEADAE